MTPSRNLSFPYMATFTTCFFLFLILSLPYFSTGRSQLLESEMYEIDYRGPETHSSTPPPDHSHATSLGDEAKFKKGLMGRNTNIDQKEEKVKRIHG